MVVFSYLYTQRGIVLCAAVLLVCTTAAEASDWRQKLRERPQAGVARPHIVEPGSAFAYAGSFKGGYTSNANEDFDPIASATSQSTHELEIRHKDGDRILGLEMHGSIDAAYAAESIDYADFGTQVSAAWKTVSDSVMSVSASYTFEHDDGFRSHDTGVSLNLRRPVQGKAVFTTLTLDAITHESQSFFGLKLDRDDSDRLRVGFEHGTELSAHGIFTPGVSVGAVGVRRFQAVDNAGYRRDSAAAFVRTGVSISGEGRLGGEAGVMLFYRDYEDALFKARTMLLPEAELTWKVSETTELALSYLADLEETPFYGSSNQQTVTAALALTHRLDKNHSLSGVIFEERSLYLETDLDERTRGAGLELTRKINDSLAISVGGEFERLTVRGFDEAADTWAVSVGLTTAFSQ